MVKTHTDDEVFRDGCIMPLRGVARTTEKRLRVICFGVFAVHGVVGDTRCARHYGLNEILRICS